MTHGIYKIRFHVVASLALVLLNCVASLHASRQSRYYSNKEKHCLKNMPRETNEPFDEGYYLWTGVSLSVTRVSSTSPFVHLGCRDVEFRGLSRNLHGTARNPPTMIRWTKYDKTIPPSSTKFLQFGCTKRPFIYHSRLHMKNLQIEDSGIYSCQIYRRDTNEIVLQRNFRVLISDEENNSIPVRSGRGDQDLLDAISNLTLIRNETAGNRLDCSYVVNGDTQVQVSWYKDDVAFHATTDQIVACEVGTYKCEVRNRLGGFSHTFRVYNALNCRATKWMTIIPIISCFMLVSMTAYLIRMRRAKNQEKNVISGLIGYGMYVDDDVREGEPSKNYCDVIYKLLTKQGMGRYYSQNIESLQQQIPDLHFSIASDDVELVKSKEISRDRFICDTRDGEPSMLGSGYFGNVYKGRMLRDDGNHVPVAVKLLKDGFRISDLGHFIEEAATLIKAESHPNVISLLGTCMVDSFTSQQESGDVLRAPMLLMELADGGDLRSYLLQRRCDLSGYETSDGSFYTQTVTNVKEILSFAHQSALGMEHLTNRKILHRDLAARNILLTKDRVVKIGDFGLSKFLKANDYYRVRSRWEKPAKWTAPEALMFDKYTLWSDVWSFGVLIWEIFTLGGEPYPEINPKDLYSYLKSGKRLPRPELATLKIYETMKSCWDWTPQNRKTFTDLSIILRNLLNDAQIEISVCEDTNETRRSCVYSSISVISSSVSDGSSELPSSSKTDTSRTSTKSENSDDSALQNDVMKSFSRTCVLPNIQLIDHDQLVDYETFEMSCSYSDSDDDDTSPINNVYMSHIQPKPRHLPVSSTPLTLSSIRDGLILENQTYVNSNREYSFDESSLINLEPTTTNYESIIIDFTNSRFDEDKRNFNGIFKAFPDNLPRKNKAKIPIIKA